MDVRIKINDHQIAIVESTNDYSFTHAIINQLNMLNEEFQRHQFNGKEFSSLIGDYIEQNINIFSRLWEGDVETVLRKIYSGENGIETQQAQVVVELFQISIIFYQKNAEAECLQPLFRDRTELLMSARILYTNEGEEDKFHSVIGIQEMMEMVNGRDHGAVELSHIVEEVGTTTYEIVECKNTKGKFLIYGTNSKDSWLDAIKHQLFWTENDEEKVQMEVNELEKYATMKWTENWMEISEILERKVEIYQSEGPTEIFMGKRVKRGTKTIMIWKQKGSKEEKYASVLETQENGRMIQKESGEKEIGIEQRRNGQTEYTNRKTEQAKQNDEISTRVGSFYTVGEYGTQKELIVKTIVGDGNCLVRAILDQLNKNKEKYKCDMREVKKLRQRIANHMMQNRARYEMYLVESLQEGGFLSFIEQVKKSGVWLGHESMVAVTELYDKCIMLYQTDGGTITIGEQKEREEDILRILYTGENGKKNHFDSIRGIVDEVMQIEEENRSALIADAVALEEQEIGDVLTYSGIEAENESAKKHVNKKQEDSGKEKTGNLNISEEEGERLIRVASLNVRGCSKLEKRQEIDSMLNDFNVEVAALQEVNARAERITTENYDWRVGAQGSNKSRGLAILLKKGSDIEMKEWIEIGNQAISVSLTTKGKKIVLINVHSPNKKGYVFYSKLGNIIDRNHLRENLLMLGDWNAQIGRDSVTPEEKGNVGEKLGFAKSNENGEDFKMFTIMHKIKIVSSEIGINTETTWRSGKKESQIDHVLRPLEGSIEIRYIKGFWTRIETDHKMLITAVRTREKESKKKEKKKIQLDPEILKYDCIKEKYHKALNKHKENENKRFSIEDKYKDITRRMKKAAEEALRSSRAPLTPIRKKALNRLQKALHLTNKHPDMLPYKWKLRDRRHEFEEAIRSHNERKVRNFYKNLNDFDVAVRIKKSYQFLSQFLKRRKRKRTHIPMSHWNEELKESEGPEIELMDIHDTCPMTEPPREEEMLDIIQKQCNGKSAGADGIRMEHIKYANKDIKTELTEMWKQIWIENNMPEAMNETIQVPIPKKNVTKGTKDYRRISLCNVSYKPYAKWIKQRLREFTGDPDINQAAFTEGRSTDDHMFVTRRILEEHWNAGRPAYVAALDISKAFDNVSLHQLKNILTKLNVPSHLIDRVLQCIRRENMRVKWLNQYTKQYRRGKGIKQGCPLSPFLFNLVMQEVIRKVKERIPELNMLSEGSLKLPIILVFADDILIIAKDQNELERIIIALEDCLKEVGLEINNEKSQILIRVPNAATKLPDYIELNSRKYDVKTTLRYLGTWLTDTLNRPATTKQRCVNAAKVSKLVIEFCKKFKPTWEIGKLIYNTVIAPSILYGTKTATLTKRSRVQLGRYEKQILKDIWNNCRKTSNIKFNVRKELKGKTINRRVRVNRISYYGHIQRRPERHPIKTAMKLNFKKKKHGRPSFTWKNSLKQDFDRYNGMTEEDWRQLAMDRDKIKKKAEEIYKNDDSEISDGEEISDENM